jgi:hypothetical protein
VPRTCTICRHEESFAINEELVRREPYRHIASRYGVSTTALQRHSREHIPLLLLQASQAQKIAEADDLLASVKALYQEARGVLETAKGQEDYRLVLSAIDRAGRQVELLARLRGGLQEGVVLNLHLHPQWNVIQGVVYEVLEPYPQAREEATKKFLQLGGGVNGQLP